MIEIIYMTTYLKPNSSKPSMFQRNTAEKARFHTQNLFNYKNPKNKLSNCTRVQNKVQDMEKATSILCSFHPSCREVGLAVTLSSLDPLCPQLLSSCRE